MKAQDLRIGNLVYNTIEKNNYEIKGQDIYNLEQGMDSFVFEPIPLTEEWLLKMPEMERMYASVYYTNKLKFDINNLGKVRFHFSGKVVYVDYLHQIQNIVFALTNNELKIKL